MVTQVLRLQVTLLAQKLRYKEQQNLLILVQQVVDFTEVLIYLVQLLQLKLLMVVQPLQVLQQFHLQVVAEQPRQRQQLIQILLLHFTLQIQDTIIRLLLCHFQAEMYRHQVQSL